MNEFKGTPGPWRVNTIGKHWNNPALVHLEVTFGTDGNAFVTQYIGAKMLT